MSSKMQAVLSKIKSYVIAYEAAETPLFIWNTNDVNIWTLFDVISDMLVHVRIKCRFLASVVFVAHTLVEVFSFYE